MCPHELQDNRFCVQHEHLQAVLLNGECKVGDLVRIKWLLFSQKLNSLTNIIETIKQVKKILLFYLMTAGGMGFWQD